VLQDLAAGNEKHNENSRQDFRFLTDVWRVKLYNTKKGVLTTKYPKLFYVIVQYTFFIGYCNSQVIHYGSSVGDIYFCFAR